MAEQNKFTPRSYAEALIPALEFSIANADVITRVNPDDKRLPYVLEKAQSAIDRANQQPNIDLGSKA